MEAPDQPIPSEPTPDAQLDLLSDHLMPTGWDLLLTREQKLAQPGRYTLERIEQDEGKVRAIIAGLGAGFSARDICRAMHVHHRVVAGLLGKHAETIDAAKRRAGNKMMRTAELCVDFFREQLLAGEVTARDASIAAGIFADKGLLFAGDPTVIVGQAERPQRTLEELNRYIAELPSCSHVDVPSTGKGEESQ